MTTTVQIRAAWASFREAQKGETWALPFAQFDHWLAGIKAAAWDEGAESAYYPESRDQVGYPSNPYRTP